MTEDPMTRTMALFLILVAYAAVGAQQNPVPNPSFESVTPQGPPVGWSLSPRDVANGRSVLAADAAADGQRSLKLSSAAGEGPARAISDRFTVQSGQWYVVRWKSKTQQVDGSATVDAVFDRPVRADGVLQAATVDWMQHEYLTKVPEGQTQMQVAPLLFGAGTAWFDQIEVLPCQPPSRPAPGLDKCFFLLPAQAGCRLAYNYPVVKLFSADPWPHATQLESVAVSLARNEHEAFQVAVWPERDVRIERVDVANPGDLEISCRRVATIDLPETCVHDMHGRPGPNPDALYPVQPFTIKAGDQALLWVDVYAPAAARPGDHQFTLTLHATQPLTIPVRAHVWDIALPTKPRLRSFGNTQIRDMTGRYRAAEQEITNQLADNLRRHRVAPWELALGPLRATEWVSLRPDGAVTIDFSAFDQAVEAYHAQGFEGFVMTPRNFRARGGGYKIWMRPWLGLTPLTPAFDRAYGDYCRQMAAHLREKGWLDEAWWYPWDEPNEREYDDFRRIVEIIKSADKGLLVSVGGPNLPLPRFYGLVDVWTTNLRGYEVNALAPRISERQAAGDEVGAYGNNRYSVQFPLIWPRLWGWTLFRYGLTHTGWWSIALWQGDAPRPGAPADSESSDPGAGMFVYPPSADGEICDSMRWEAIRDGVEEYELLCLLAERRGRPRALELAGQLVWGSYSWEFERDAAKLAEVRQRIANEM